jgi:phosphoglycerate dehydrogenase-like enzyme
VNIVIWPERPDWDKAVRDAAGSATVVSPTTEAEALAAAPEAEGWIGNMNPALLKAAKKLRWMQAPTISLERVIFPELAESNVTLTNMQQTSNVEVATHATTLFLALCRDLTHLFRQQQALLWKREAKIRDIPTMTVIVMGLGAIGREACKQIAALGARIIGVDPTLKDAPPGVAELAHPDKLPELLPKVDALVCIAPLTPNTMGLFDDAMFKRMKKDALFVNVGRGQIVKTDSLLRALKEGWIERAAIDVCDPEPLPSDHPLWKLDNIIITPHLATLGSRIRERQLDCVVENVKSFVAGKPFGHIANKKLWF